MLSKEDMQFVENLFRSLEREMNNRFDGVNARFDGVDARLDRMDVRLARMDRSVSAGAR